MEESVVVKPAGKAPAKVAAKEVGTKAIEKTASLLNQHLARQAAAPKSAHTCGMRPF